MKFNDVLREEFYDTLKYKSDYSDDKLVIELWRNPSSIEFSEIMKGNIFVRGVLLKDGNLFLTNSNEIIHDDILVILEKRGVLKFNKFWFDDVKMLENYLCIQIDKRKIVKIAESYRENVFNAITEKYGEIYSKVLEKKNKMFGLKIE